MLKIIEEGLEPLFGIWLQTRNRSKENLQDGTNNINMQLKLAIDRSKSKILINLWSDWCLSIDYNQPVVFFFFHAMTPQ